MTGADSARAGCCLIGMAALLASAGCQRSEPNANATGAAASSVATPAPAPSPTGAATPAASGSLARYAGKYPFDKVDGVAFLDAPAVTGAVDRLIGDASIRKLVLGGDGPGTPIARRDGKLIAWGCETHNCGDHNWSMLIAPDGSSAEICYHDAAAMHGRSHWYGDSALPAMRDGDCPSA